MNDKGGSLGGQWRRYARVGSAVSGLAANYAGRRLLGRKVEHDAHARELAAAVGGLKGPLMKVAQILATIPDALPSAYAEELRQLQADAPSMGWPFVRRRMAGELGPNWRQHFQDFEQSAAHAASLGQVHRATAPDGARFACKLQYPEMAAAVEADLRQLRLVFSIYERRDRAVRTESIFQELSDRLREELDYRREAKHMRLYGAILSGEPDVTVPAPVEALSTARLLTMTWIDGRPLLEAADLPVEARNRLAETMFRAWYVPFYECGVIHGDPHLGNYSMREDFGINLLDFGCIRIFPPTFVKGVIDLYRALRDGDEALAVSAYETWGFETPSRALIEVLNIWAEFLYAPLLKDRVQRIQESESGLYGAGVAARVHSELRRIGGVRPPREFVLMDRAAIGLGSVFMRLRAEVNWHRLFHGLIDGFDADTLAARQSAMLEAAGLK
ncbi:MAG: AarF/ABC1/UbiB kinase family protein [Alphaproteobacteria bacterium]|nr:AarF/ABC1/UbiB kinase family protein [Alphaproteobacteria bacterium]